MPHPGRDKCLRSSPELVLRMAQPLLAWGSRHEDAAVQAAASVLAGSTLHLCKAVFRGMSGPWARHLPQAAAVACTAAAAVMKGKPCRGTWYPYCITQECRYAHGGY